jgi:hypothetical protein
MSATTCELATTNKPKTVYLIGGLGNVLFQLNLAHSLRDQGFFVRLNTFAIEGKSVLGRLLGWSDHGTLAQVNVLNLLSTFNLDGAFSASFLKGFFSKKLKRAVIDTKFFGLASPTHGEVRTVSEFIGYFHNNNPVNNGLSLGFAASMQQRLEINGQLRNLVEEVSVRDAIVVHVRGGDFKSDADGRLGRDYYARAIALAEGGKSRPIYVVTNDIEYATYVLRGIPHVLVSQNDAIDDFILLAKAPSKILANSTFSWWAAEFGPEDSRIIEVAPYYPTLVWDPVSRRSRIRLAR